jgi:nucleoside-diphosphate-sugar epimerase
MPHAFVLGGGQIGGATALRFLDAGWSVTLGQRSDHSILAGLFERGVNIVRLDRSEERAFRTALGSGADALIDIVGYGPEHALQLLDVQRSVGSLIVVSSASVYCDAERRTLDEASENGFPEFPGPISETQSIVDPGSDTYSTRKVAMERLLLDRAVVPTTIVRPAAVSGVPSTHPREWWFVKRVLDQRPLIPLAYEGRSRFHTTSAANIAALMLRAASLSGKRILNIADPAVLSVGEIATLILSQFEYSGRVVALPDEGLYPASIGWTPWSVPRPFVLDTKAALSIGYEPVTTYSQTAAHVCKWLVRATAGRDWRKLFPILAAYPRELFDYEREDAMLGSAARSID